MKLSKEKYLRLFFIFILIIIFVSIISIVLNKIKKDAILAEEPITINLITNVHPNLPWSFKSANKKITVKPGEVVTIEYFVKNLENKNTTGIATFAYFPNQFEQYIRKLNCFCYDAQTLNANQQEKYSVVLLIDPEVTKDSKTKNVKEVTIQFTFFDYKEYNKNKS